MIAVFNFGNFYQKKEHPDEKKKSILGIEKRFSIKPINSPGDHWRKEIKLNQINSMGSGLNPLNPRITI